MIYFGTDGIRGKYGTFPITDVFFRQLGHSIRISFPEVKNIVIGCDTRYSGDALANAIQEGIGKDVHFLHLGVTSSPYISQSVTFYQADMGIMITASHNSPEYNGVKIFNQYGDKISTEQEQTIESNIDLNMHTFDDTITQLVKKDVHIYYPDLVNEYPLHAVIDTAHGSATSIAKLAYKFKSIHWLGDAPNGYNINTGCGSEHPQLLSQTVVETQADIGIAHDGDGDRVLLCDRCGRLIPGEVILGILSLDFFHRGQLSNNAIVTTNVSNCGLEHSLQKLGISTYYSDVGDRNVSALMHQLKCNLGGESSGHVIIKDYSPTSDGVLTALLFLSALDRLHISLEDAGKYIQLYPQKVGKIPIRVKLPLQEIPSAWDVIKSCEQRVGDDGKIFLRYSGTEPILRLVVESKSQDIADLCYEEIKNALANAKEII